jgi:hypothetical protein
MELGGNGYGLSRVGAYVTEPLANNKIFQDQVFGISKRLTIGDSEVINIGIDATAVDCDFLVLLPIAVKALGAGPLNIDLYVGSTFTGGTEIVSSNRNLDSSVTAKLKWYLAPTITGDGTKAAPEFTVLSNGTAAVSKITGESAEDLPINMVKGIKYIIRITNTAANSGTGAIANNWFELCNE